MKKLYFHDMSSEYVHESHIYAYIQEYIFHNKLKEKKKFYKIVQITETLKIVIFF